jgi:hypothetical protein
MLLLNISVNKSNNKITELRTIFQRESQNSYKQTKSVNNGKTVKTVMTLTWYVLNLPYSLKQSIRS